MHKGPTSNRALTVAYYLPQFHTIPENDAWWGEGFTEWVNVKRALPQFSGHDHPRAAATLGEYDLNEVDVMHEQARLASAHDIDAFCFYFYWFDGTRLLEKPLDNYIERGPDFPFCLSWANENWTRRWDGKENEVLIGQNYTNSTADEIFASFLPYFSDSRYLRLDGSLVLVVHRIDHIPNAVSVTARWKQLAQDYGLGTLHIIAAETKFGITPAPFGVDAVAEFPPVGSNTLRSAQIVPLRGLHPKFSGRLMSYPRMAKRFMRRKSPNFPRYKAVAPGWDNTARRGQRATIYVGNNPDVYGKWLSHAREVEERRPDSTGLVFINAWNEWAEGAYLEPDSTWGNKFLEATRRDYETDGRPATIRVGRPSVAWIRSLALTTAGSALSLLRNVRSGIR